MNIRDAIAAMFVSFVVVIGMFVLVSTPAYAHCDSMDGPVVKAAQAALARGDVNLVLIWVRKNDEPELRRAFERTLEVRKLSPQAKELADMYFFETLVRIHRAGEGAPYTGIKPVGSDVVPAIPAADRAIQSGDITPLDKLLVEKMHTELLARYKQVMAARKFKTEDVHAGREYVERYVAFIHYVESMYEAAARPASGHYPEGAAVSRHEE